MGELLGLLLELAFVIYEAWGHAKPRRDRRRDRLWATPKVPRPLPERGGCV
jgi:hypothetical protein